MQFPCKYNAFNAAKKNNFHIFGRMKKKERKVSWICMYTSRYLQDKDEHTTTTTTTLLLINKLNSLNHDEENRAQLIIICSKWRSAWSARYRSPLISRRVFVVDPCNNNNNNNNHDYHKFNNAILFSFLVGTMIFAKW